MPTSGGARIAITASRKQISREIKQLMGNGGGGCEAGRGEKKKPLPARVKVLTTGLVFSLTGAQCIVERGVWDWFSCQWRSSRSQQMLCFPTPPLFCPGTIVDVPQMKRPRGAFDRWLPHLALRVSLAHLVQLPADGAGPPSFRFLDGFHYSEEKLEWEGPSLSLRKEETRAAGCNQWWGWSLIGDPPSGKARFRGSRSRLTIFKSSFIPKSIQLVNKIK